MTAVTWTTDVDTKGSYRGYTGYVVGPDQRRNAVVVCAKTPEEARERAEQALPMWVAFYESQVPA